jgi:hypothetical protein
MSLHAIANSTWPAALMARMPPSVVSTSSRGREKLTPGKERHAFVAGFVRAPPVVGAAGAGAGAGAGADTAGAGADAGDAVALAAESSILRFLVAGSAGARAACWSM